ncbi:MAG TPA: right-handed parallel beta-helix repeat-containing protein [Candidatus Hydrogenedens sp.]|nr:right-handed parallel beta-helix repeat-containing protein [Candidatus Hydrogenedens sp.]HPP59549.1 right-handed parallel beta-helix repeat-containing protein [Candidatus Hydrogenedens sp.]
MDVKKLFFISIILLINSAYPSDLKVSLYQPNHEAISQVEQGSLNWASPAWWGFNEQDATESLQSAINSNAEEVIVPNMGVPWIVRPITLRSNQKITLMSGVVILAKKGEFKGGGDSLFSADNVENLTISGYGATLKMNKKDYQDKKQYKPAEWRMTLSICGCKNVLVEGIRCESSGGDGIYIGATNNLNRCENVLIRDVVCYDNHRQGISVISASNLTIENCLLIGTSGTAPQAGIDFEPNQESEQLTNIVMKNCMIKENKGAGILIYLKQFDKTTLPVSITVENCFIQNDFDHGVAIGAVTKDGPLGDIKFKNCYIEGSQRGGICVFDKSADGVKIYFDNCVCVNTPPKSNGFPIKINQWKKTMVAKLGGVCFNDCVVYDIYERSPIEINTLSKDCQISDIRGTIIVKGKSLPKVENKTGFSVNELVVEK